MLAPSVLQPRKSEVKHGVRYREQRRKQEALRQHANRSTTPSTSATASIVRESQSPQRAPDSPARARPRHARPPSTCRAPSAPGRKPGSGALAEPSIGLPNVDRARHQALVALAKPSPQRASPRRAPGRNRAPERKPSRAARSRSISQAGPQRTPTPPMHARTKTGLRSVTQAEQRVPAARNRHFCPAAVKRNDSSQTQGQNTRFFALSEGPYADKRQKRPSLTSETAKNRLF